MKKLSFENIKKVNEEPKKGKICKTIKLPRPTLKDNSDEVSKEACRPFHLPHRFSSKLFASKVKIEKELNVGIINY